MFPPGYFRSKRNSQPNKIINTDASNTVMNGSWKTNNGNMQVFVPEFVKENRINRELISFINQIKQKS